MEENVKRTSIFANSLIWFGAAVSISEFVTGTLVAPLGFEKGLLSVLVGHIIGCVLLWLAGIIGGKTRKCAMDTVKLAFGSGGGGVFSALNVLQLVGWTAVMLSAAGSAANAALNIGGAWVWCCIIGVLIIVWTLVGNKALTWLNTASMLALLVLCILLCTVVFDGSATAVTGGEISFGAAVELSVAMPISWLPLIADYTRDAKRPTAATHVSAITYFIVSSFMFVLGMAAALFTGKSDLGEILTAAGFGIVALLIIVFSTVTTTYLDVYSAAVSAGAISKRLREKPVAVVVGLLGIALACFLPSSRYESFLYLISSVFTPMAAILFCEFFILKGDSSSRRFDIPNLIVWGIGFVLYQLMLYVDTPIGVTLPVMAATAVICLAVKAILKSITKSKKEVNSNAR